jgi:hypothetical protein
VRRVGAAIGASCADAPSRIVSIAYRLDGHENKIGTCRPGSQAGGNFSNWNSELFVLTSSRGGCFNCGSEPMLQKISLRDAKGKLVSGSFAVRKGTITVTAPDGRTKTAVVAESLLNTEMLARSLLLLLNNEKQQDRKIIRGKN